MNAPRFFVDASFEIGQALALPPAVAHHAQHSLRLRDGAAIVLFNGRGGEFGARLRAGTRAGAIVEAFDPIERESALATTLVQAWVATDRLDWIVEKATELGVTRIVLAPTQRSVVQLASERLARRLARLAELAVAACCQCGRNRVPVLTAAGSWNEAMETVAAADPDGQRRLLNPRAETGLAVPAGARSIALAVGPEGGFCAPELASAEHAGWQAARLGARVLRTESAGVIALAVVQTLAGDFAPN